MTYFMADETLTIIEAEGSVWTRPESTCKCRSPKILLELLKLLERDVRIGGAIKQLFNRHLISLSQSNDVTCSSVIVDYVVYTHTMSLVELKEDPGEWKLYRELMSLPASLYFALRVSFEPSCIEGNASVVLQ